MVERERERERESVCAFHHISFYVHVSALEITAAKLFFCAVASRVLIHSCIHHRKGDAQAMDLKRVPSQLVFAAATLPDWKGDKVKSVVRWLKTR